VLIPLRHENMRGRRWPVITFALIAINIVVFLFTTGPIQRQQPERSQTRIHLLVFAAMHQDLRMSPGAEAYINGVKKKLGYEWDKAILASQALVAMAAPASNSTQSDDPALLQQQMDSLCQAFDTERKTDILDNYAFVPAESRPISYVTANFLHGGWLHLLGNMWFLWLAGFILEDNWGRVIYPIFYLFAGAAALQFYGWCAYGSYMPLIGASGAVAALMGAFLVRFPKLKIEMAFLAFFSYRFKAPAYALLPLWLLMEFYYGSVLGVSSPVAHWAHVGGFLFGMAAAWGLARSGLEQKAYQEVESKIAWTAAPEMVQAGQAVEESKFDDAASILVNYIQQHPSALDALQMLQQVQWRRNDIPGYLEATAKLCQSHLKQRDTEAAWQDFEAYSNAGGDKLPAPIWLEIGRMLETQQNIERAVTEYERLAEVHPDEKQSILALIAAGRLYLKRLNRPEEALNCYERANASKVPHLDWQPTIDSGLAAAKAAITANPRPVPSQT
jgi:membrane associated rhomboid family serine protease